MVSLDIIPRRMGESRSYVANGRTFVVKRLRRDTWFLRAADAERGRFGNLREIAEDIRYTHETGALPRARYQFA